MGSTAIYSDQVPRPMREADLWLGAPHGSEAGYAHAKRAMLAQLGAYHEQYGLDYAFCIATNMFGPNDRFDEQNGHVIPSLLSKFERAIRNGEPVEVWGTGTPRRDFLFSHDAAHAMRLVGERFTGRSISPPAKPSPLPTWWRQWCASPVSQEVLFGTAANRMARCYATTMSGS